MTNPFNVDDGGDLNGADLFFLGANTLFTAPTAGQLFFGINDPVANNNSGSFTVTVSDPSAIPLPAALPIMAVTLGGIMALGAIRRRR